MKILEHFKKQRALKTYVKVLPPLLKKRYGKHKRYTEGQVRKTAEAAGLNNKYIDFAYAMYMSRREFETFTSDQGLSCSYEECRKTIADDYFHGNASFTIHDALDSANTSSGFFGSGSGTDVGGCSDHGGDAD